MRLLHFFSPLWLVLACSLLGLPCHGVLYAHVPTGGLFGCRSSRAPQFWTKNRGRTPAPIETSGKCPVPTGTVVLWPATACAATIEAANETHFGSNAVPVWRFHASCRSDLFQSNDP